MRLELANPRGHVTAASIIGITSLDGKPKWMLDVQTSIARESQSEICNSVAAAKRLFSTHILRPKYHGKNIWKEQ